MKHEILEARIVIDPAFTQQGHKKIFLITISASTKLGIVLWRYMTNNECLLNKPDLLHFHYRKLCLLDLARNYR
jgi:hypothetical protein